jgi:hypothetical protein
MKDWHHNLKDQHSKKHAQQINMNSVPGAHISLAGEQS